MSDYRGYKMVISAYNNIGILWQLKLECGHTVYRKGRCAPEKVKCEVCECEKVGQK